MKLKHYQEKAVTTAQYPQIGSNVVYPALGLAGEAGEVVEKVKKLWRNRGITAAVQMSEEDKRKIADELGDVLWYIAAMCFELGIPLEKVAAWNIEKLTDRRARGVVKSEGDNR